MPPFLETTLPGAAGGLTWFIVGLHKGWIKNNKYIKKGALEIVGGSLVGTFITIPLLLLLLPQYTVSFIAGAAWSVLIQRARKAITKRIERDLK